MSLVILPRQFVTNINGEMLVGAKLYVYDATTTNPRTPYPTAADAVAGTNPLSNPVESVSNGLFPAVYVNTEGGPYKVVITTAAGATIYTEDNIAASASLTSAEIATTLNSLKRTPAEDAAGVTPTDYAYPEGWDLRYGVVRDDSTDNQIALTNCILVGRQVGGPEIVLTSGIARHSNTLDWGFNNLRVRAQGYSRLRHTGTGVANSIGTAVGGLNGVQIGLGAYLEELGNANTTYCWEVQACHRSYINVRAKNCTAAGMRIRFAVRTEFHFSCTGEDAAFTTTPVNGLILDHRGAGEYVAFCTFYDTNVEIVSGVGVVLTDSSGNVFFGGTSEGNGRGVSVADICRYNTFVNFDCENNQDAAAGVDWDIRGVLNQFINTHSKSTAHAQSTIVQNSSSIQFTGGYHRSVQLESTALDTVFNGFGTSSSPGIGIQGTGTYRQIGTVEYDGSFTAVNRPNDILGPVGSFTATLTGCDTSPAGSVTYSVNGDAVTMRVPAITGTSNTTAATLTGVPAALRPAVQQRGIGVTVDNGTTAIAVIQIETDGTITLFKVASVTFTNSGTKGTSLFDITYRLST